MKYNLLTGFLPLSNVYFLDFQFMRTVFLMIVGESIGRRIKYKISSAFYQPKYTVERCKKEWYCDYIDENWFVALATFKEMIFVGHKKLFQGKLSIPSIVNQIEKPLSTLFKWILEYVQVMFLPRHESVVS